MKGSTLQNYHWWQTGIIYQIYPRSYQDSDGDGIGDLNGIIRRLDYVRSLNVNAIWLSPIFPSPMADFGYDVADYTNIDPMFGNLNDFDRLLAETHARGMKLLLDLVPNHSSIQHEWFVESRSSRHNPKRDWYIWAEPGPDGEPPNNWLSFFGGPAWSYDENTAQYYLHQFVSEQPELNYRNPDVLEAMLGEMRFWLERGVDGFRVDVIWLMIKDDLLRDEPIDPTWDGINPYFSLKHIYTADLPEVHGIIRRMRSLLDEYDDRMMVGEIYLHNDRLMTYYGRAYDECHLPFNFQLILMQWDAAIIRKAVDDYERALPEQGWPNWVLGNHDQHRLATRVGPQQARVANMLLLTLRGIPTCYYGDEIGMQNVPIPAKFIQDPPAVNQPEIAHIVGRDPERTPMQWDAGPNAGFADSGVQTWLPLAPDYAKVNASAQSADPHSMLSFFTELTRLRQSEAALMVGEYASVNVAASDIFAYTRHKEVNDSFLIVLNFGGTAQTIDLAIVAPSATIALNTTMDRAGEVDLSALSVAPDEGLLLRLI